MTAARRPNSLETAGFFRLVNRWRTRVAITAKRPPYGNRGVKAVRARCVKVCRAQEPAITSEIVHLVLCGSQFEISRQLESQSKGAVPRDRLHRCGISDLRDISSEAQLGLNKKEKVTCQSATQRLELEVSAEKVARVGSASRSRPARVYRLRKRTSAEVGFVMRRRDGEIHVTANPVPGEKGG